MISKIVVTLCLVALAAAIPQPAQPAAGGWGAGAWGAGAWGPVAGVNPWIPPWVASAPWYPQWSPCTTIGSTCLDCNTRLVCTKVGGLQRACTDPSLPHCNLGECSATPSVECGLEQAVPLAEAA